MGDQALVQVKKPWSIVSLTGLPNPTFEKEFTKDRSPGARIRPPPYPFCSICNAENFLRSF